MEKNTELAGTIGQKKKLEAIEVKLVEKPIPVTSISLNSSKNKIDMKIGESQIQLNTSILPSNSTDQRVRFISSNSAVAEVSNSGLVTGKSTGKTVITAETVDGKKTDTIEIEVLGRGQIFTKNTEIAWGSSWNYLDNIVKAVDEYGQPIPLNEITILGTVDTSKFGYQTVAFGHPKVSGFPPVTIKVLARKRDANKVRQEYLRLVNVERQKNGVNPISVNTLLEAGSAVRVDELVTKFSYVRPNGQPASTAISLSSGHSFRYGTLAYPVKLTNTGNDTDQELAKKLFDATYLGQTTDLNGNNTPNSIRFLDKDRETLGLAFKEIEGKECLGHVFIGGRYT
ncbi:Ig-like domain-containing protein [Enterococcus termitis]